MSPIARLSRFADAVPLQQGLYIGSPGGARPFYAGDGAYDRMDRVRRAINEIRINWNLYPEFMRELREFIQIPEFHSEARGDLTTRLEALFLSTKEWDDSLRPHQCADYSAIELYTSELGYRTMFATINAAFRRDSLTGDPFAMRCGVFLVELLSIDLFNYRAANRSADNFEGQVYRGMCVTAPEFEMFARMAAGPLPERYLAIPLAMASASRSMENAIAFAIEESARRPGRVPLIWNIRVSSLEPSLLATYHAEFPASIVTSLCAVPIDEISDYGDEQEVVLRGAHFQILRIRKLDLGLSGPVAVIDAVMLNSNRDHITAIASNTGDDRRARDLFRTVVLIHRSEVCAQIAAQSGLDADAAWYTSVAMHSRHELDVLTS
jgi:hypothetical protein